MPVASITVSFTWYYLKLSISSFLSFLNRTDLRKISKQVSQELCEINIAAISVVAVVQQIILLCVFSQEFSRDL